MQVCALCTLREGDEGKKLRSSRCGVEARMTLLAKGEETRLQLRPRRSCLVLGPRAPVNSP